MAYAPWTSDFKIGSQVVVIKQSKYPGVKLLDLIGTVRSGTGGTIAVNFDTIKNEKSSYGSFYFKPNELLKVPDYKRDNVEEKTMEKITDYLNCVKVTFYGADKPSPMPYANFDPELAVGDICAVRYGTDKFDVVKVSEILDSVDGGVHNEVVAKIDVTDYNTRVQSRAKAAELKAKMQARAKQLQDIALYQMLAKNDPEMEALLNEYQGLPNV